MPQTDLVGMEVFLNWQTVVFSLGVFVMTYIVRLCVQFVWQTWRSSHMYNDFILHLLPITLGGLVAGVATKFPWPEVLAASGSARVFYGLFLGLTCGLVYGRVRKVIEITGVKTPDPAAIVPNPPGDGTKE